MCNIMSAVAQTATQSAARETRRRRVGVSERGLLTEVGRLSTFRHHDRMDGACELRVSHESFGFLIKKPRRERETT